MVANSASGKQGRVAAGGERRHLAKRTPGEVTRDANSERCRLRAGYQLKREEDEAKVSESARGVVTKYPRTLPFSTSRSSGRKCDCAKLLPRDHAGNLVHLSDWIFVIILRRSLLGSLSIVRRRAIESTSCDCARSGCMGKRMQGSVIALTLFVTAEPFVHSSPLESFSNGLDLSQPYS